jgi:cytochrome c oxidase subunit 4
VGTLLALRRYRLDIFVAPLVSDWRANLVVIFQAELNMQPTHSFKNTRPALTRYFIVYAVLIAFTALTVAVSFINLGAWHTLIGLLIATLKATLVFFVFMHLKEAGPRTWLVIGASLFWLSILIGLTLNDYLTRPAMFF